VRLDTYALASVGQTPQTDLARSFVIEKVEVTAGKTAGSEATEVGVIGGMMSPVHTI
jgi:hypothetical protein